MLYHRWRERYLIGGLVCLCCVQVHMSMELVHQISVDLPEVECIKSEALPSPAKIAQLRKLWEGTPAACGDCTILSGLGALYVI